MKFALSSVSHSITIHLDPNTAYYLKAICQNPGSEDETSQSREARKIVFDALPSFDLLVSLADNEEPNPTFGKD